MTKLNDVNLTDTTQTGAFGRSVPKAPPIIAPKSALTTSLVNHVAKQYDRVTTDLPQKYLDGIDGVDNGPYYGSFADE
jgi:hypothetical protein